MGRVNARETSACDAPGSGATAITWTVRGSSRVESREWDPAGAGRRLLHREFRTPALGQLRLQERHLVGEDVAVAEDQVLDPARPVRHRQQRHSRLLRRAVALARIAVEAGREDVFPYVASTLGYGQHVVAGKVRPAEVVAAVEAQIGVAREQGGVG